MPILWPENGRRIFLPVEPTAFLGTAGPLCSKSRATAQGGARGTATPIETSVTWGGIHNNPFGRNHLDQAGLGIIWDKTNLQAVAQPARNAEWGTELYYNYVLFKALWLTPDVQLYFDPALHPGAGPAAVFTIRTTALF